MWKTGDVENIIENALNELDGYITEHDKYYGSELITTEIKRDYENCSMIISIESTPLNDGNCPEKERLRKSLDKFKITVEMIDEM